MFEFFAFIIERLLFNAIVIEGPENEILVMDPCGF